MKPFDIEILNNISEWNSEIGCLLLPLIFSTIYWLYFMINLVLFVCNKKLHSFVYNSSFDEPDYLPLFGGVLGPWSLMLGIITYLLVCAIYILSPIILFILLCFWIRRLTKPR